MIAWDGLIPHTSVRVVASQSSLTMDPVFRSPRCPLVTPDKLLKVVVADAVVGGAERAKLAAAGPAGFAGEQRAVGRAAALQPRRVDDLDHPRPVIGVGRGRREHFVVIHLRAADHHPHGNAVAGPVPILVGLAVEPARVAGFVLLHEQPPAEERRAVTSVVDQHPAGGPRRPVTEFVSSSTGGDGSGSGSAPSNGRSGSAGKSGGSSADPIPTDRTNPAAEMKARRKAEGGRRKAEGGRRNIISGRSFGEELLRARSHLETPASSRQPSAARRTASRRPHAEAAPREHIERRCRPTGRSSAHKVPRTPPPKTAGS